MSNDKPAEFACSALERKIAEMAWAEIKPVIMERIEVRAAKLVDEAFSTADKIVRDAMTEAARTAASDAAKKAAGALVFDIALREKTDGTD
jgi:hypothetical protein